MTVQYIYYISGQEWEVHREKACNVWHNEGKHVPHYWEDVPEYSAGSSTIEYFCGGDYRREEQRLGEPLAIWTRIPEGSPWIAR